MSTKDQTYVRECFDYDPEAGVLTWRHRPTSHFATIRGARRSNSEFAGKEAGAVSPDGYRRVRVWSRNMLAHRIVWLWMTGTMPDTIDHINGDGADNRFQNLRDVSHAENMKNKALNRNNASGHPGVIWEKSKQLWVARISVDGKLKTLGRSKDKEKVVALRHAAERQFGYHVNHGRAA